MSVDASDVVMMDTPAHGATTRIRAVAYVTRSGLVASTNTRTVLGRPDVVARQRIASLSAKGVRGCISIEGKRTMSYEYPAPNDNSRAAPIAAWVDRRQASVQSCPRWQSSSGAPTALPPAPCARHAASAPVFAKSACAHRVFGLAQGIYRRLAAVVSRRALRRAERSSSFAGRGRRQRVPFARNDRFDRTLRARFQPHAGAPGLSLERTLSRTRASNPARSSSLPRLCFDEPQKARAVVRRSRARCLLIGTVVHRMEGSFRARPTAFVRCPSRCAASDVAALHGLETARAYCDE
jgi:hypothetical protein